MTVPSPAVLLLLCLVGCRGSQGNDPVAAATPEDLITMTGVRVGEQAPDVSFSLHDGRTVRLADYRGNRAVVLFFYPKDNTPLCTTEACSFRDDYEKFQAAGAEVIGVSSDSAASHARFAERHGLPYPLAVDTDGAVRRAFGVAATLGVFPGRVTYVIDREGTVRMAFSSQFTATGHVSRALEIVTEAGR